MKGEVTLGKIIDQDNPERDAIHVACAPVTAAEKLFPGQDVGLLEDGRAGVVDLLGKPIGIVDPFLSCAVLPGQRFWLLLYQNTITGLRHQWLHPAFEERQEANPEKWMRWFADKARLDYDEVIAIGHRYLDAGEYYIEHDTQRARDLAYEHVQEFWKHWSAVTGRKVPEDEKDSVPFSCSC